MTYKPTAAIQEILDVAWNHIQSVGYSVSARWLFYRLLQDSIFTTKEDYKTRFLPILTRARKAFHQGWKPDSLADTGRSSTIRGAGSPSVGEWFRGIQESGVICELDIWTEQPNYLEIWFEAEAMAAQFRHYTDHITLRPFKGDPSLDFKWSIAMALREKEEQYPGKPIKILYFGDLDRKGLSIPTSAVADIREWSEVPFDFERCGLNPDHPEKFNIPENPEKPGTYQWEALSDQAAADLITGAVSKYFDQEAAEGVIGQAAGAESWLLEQLQGLTLPEGAE